MYEELTVEDVKSNIISRISSDIDTREGSFTNDMISGVAYEIWKLYRSLDSIIPIVYVDESSGEYIDKKCAEYGIVRKQGTKALTTLMISGVDGTLVPEGKVFLTSEGVEFATNETKTITGGTASVTALSVEIGSSNNVNAGTITKQYYNLDGITSVTNSAATGGTDPETDKSLLTRLYNYLQKPTTSGNIAHYKQWALEVSGVGNTKVFPLWNGPGTVKVLIVGYNNGPVDLNIVENCYEHIEENRPIGAEVTVISAEGLTINVVADAIIDSSTTIEQVQNKFEAALNEYLQSIAFETYTVVYNRIGYILLNIPGVIDYLSLKINGGEISINIGSDQVPVLGTVVVT
jgi:Uncharacterized homolog of phage Mu protein gp47